MKRIIALVLVFVLCVPSVSLGAKGDAPLGHLTKLGAPEEVINTELAEVYFAKIPFSGFMYFETFSSMVSALGSGRIAAFCVDEYIADYLIARTKQYKKSDLPGVPVYNVNFSMLLREGDTELCERISSAIKDIKADGTLAVMKKQYIDDCIAGTDPEAVKPEHFNGAATLKVALTGDRPPMDYFSEAGEPIGFNTALVSEIARRLKMNAEFISIDSGARATALASKSCDAVFWSEAGDYNDREGSDVDDRPEHSLITEAYLGCKLVYVTLSNSPLVQK